METISHTDYDDIQVSNMGNIKYESEYITYVSDCSSSYRRITLVNKHTGEQRHYLAHRSVMDSFVEKADHLQVNYINRNKMNNKLDNLEYITQ